MAEQRVRIGIVGAGNNTRTRHIPGFRGIPGVEIVGVVNRSPESTARVAEAFGIPRTYSDWPSLVADRNVDAVCIGTWPNLHCEVTCAALTAGKHVLCEARMARNAAEAHRMLDASRAHPDLVAQIVPSPFGLVQDQFVRQLIADNYIGELREVVVIGADDTFWDYSQELHWRQDAERSGLNVLTLGILHETLCRWVPQPVSVFAQSTTFEPQRPVPALCRQVPVTVPDSVQVLTQLPGGARGIYHMSGVVLFGPGKQIHLYGRNGTIKYLISPREELWCGRVGDTEPRRIEIPPERRGGWRVEEEFVAAIRSQEKVRLTDFATGVAYMEFTEAVARSASTGQPICLPLPSNA
jgi:predicted dehydrogenase